MAEEELDETLKEEMAKYQEVGIFTRLGKMLTGISKPHSSREYKEALIEVQRLSAPLLAFLIPVIGITILFVVTAVGNNGKEEIKVEIVQADQQEEKLDEIEEPPDTEPPPDTDVEVQMDSPNVNAAVVTESTPAPTAEPQSPKVNNVDAMMNIQSPVTMKSVMGSSRSTGVRGTYTRGGAAYGDAQTEAAVMKALRWLKHIQGANGKWPGDTAGTGLAILTYLAHGETPASKEFGPTVQKGLDFLVNSVYLDKKANLVRIAGAGGAEYGFLIATYALCETYGMTKNPNAKEAALKCLQRIVDGQTATGGWNYNMDRVKHEGGADDISFGGWAMQAIKAGKMAGLHPKGLDECIKKAIKCLKTRNYCKGCGFTYRANNSHNGRGSGGLAGVGCLCMQLLGYGKEPEVVNALSVMKDWKPTFDKKHMSGDGSSQYYSYYASQCKYQAGMCKGATPANLSAWKDWNTAQKAFYPKSIITLSQKIAGPDGKEHPMGYWLNNDVHSMRFDGVDPKTKQKVTYGLMDTCLAALQLMVYYRYLPTTSLKATEVEADVEALSKDKSGEIGVSIDI